MSNYRTSEEKSELKIKPAESKKSKVYCRFCHKLIRSKNPERKFCNENCFTSWIRNVVKPQEKSVTQIKKRKSKRVFSRNKIFSGLGTS